MVSSLFFLVVPTFLNDLLKASCSAQSCAEGDTSCKAQPGSFDLGGSPQPNGQDKSKKNIPDCKNGPDRDYVYYDYAQDGIGSQLFAKISLKAWCYKHGCQYLHNPFRTFDHNYRNNPNYVAYTESFFNLGDDAHYFDEVSANCRPKKINKELPVLNNIEHYLDATTRKKLRDLYDTGSPAPQNLLQPGAFNCVLYLRRGDKGRPERQGRGRLTNSEVINLLPKVKANYSNCIFSILTQGEWDIDRLHTTDGTDMITHFTNLDNDTTAELNKSYGDIMESDPSIRWHFNKDVWSVFDAMVKADVFIVDESNFPVMAAFYNNNTIIANAIQPGRGSGSNLHKFRQSRYINV